MAEKLWTNEEIQSKIEFEGGMYEALSWGIGLVHCVDEQTERFLRGLERSFRSLETLVGAYDELMERKFAAGDTNTFIVDFEPAPEFMRRGLEHSLMTVEEFFDREDGYTSFFIDYDGHGEWATDIQENGLPLVDSGKFGGKATVYAGSTNIKDKPAWATHVLWYNR